jgi:DNA topoisomerase-3
MKTAIITEKPSVAREIAVIVGASAKENGFLAGNNYLVTWALGHLVQLAMPEEYGLSGFIRENLPIIPERFKLIPRQIKEGKTYKPDAGAWRQLQVIGYVFASCERIIVATDAGREGELIFRYIYHYLDCHKPFDRLWISSLTEKAIRNGLHKLLSGAACDNLYQAAQARSRADWLVGINGSQALSIAAGGGVFSLGRVQTPTLTMVCKRFLENRNFVPVPFFQVRVQTAKQAHLFFALSCERYAHTEETDKVLFSLQEQKTLHVQSIEKREVHQEPPLLYDLTALQQEANRKHGFSADKTHSLAQKLYEAAAISYPRTGSRYISADVFDEIAERIRILKSYSPFSACAELLGGKALPLRPVDDRKVTDHHALLITEKVPESLSGDEQTIYEMIAGRMLEAFSEPCTKEVTTLRLFCGETLFEAKATRTKYKGWRMVFNNAEEDGEAEMGMLPEVSKGDSLPLLQCELLEKQTQPQALYTEASLLGAMENAGRHIENEAQREAMKGSGIGTAATRAAIIETLFAHIRREQRSLVPTDKGLAVYHAIKDKGIADAAMTGEWENALLQIERGYMQPEAFDEAIKNYTRQITAELLETSLALTEGHTCLCPKCNRKTVRFYPQVVKCTDGQCGLVVFRNVSNKRLSDLQIRELMNKGKTGIIKGFKSKSGKNFEAALRWDENYRVIFDFPEKIQGHAKE